MGSIIAKFHLLIYNKVTDTKRQEHSLNSNPEVTVHCGSLFPVSVDRTPNMSPEWNYRGEVRIRRILVSSVIQHRNVYDKITEDLGSENELGPDQSIREIT